MNRIFAPLVALVLVLTACDQQDLFEKLVPTQETAIAKRLIAQLSAHEYESIENQLDSSDRTPATRKKLEEMANQIPSSEPRNVRIVGSNTAITNSVSRYDLTFEYEYSTDWVVANVLLERRDGKLVLQGLHVAHRAQSLETENEFSLTNKSALHYLVLALAFVIPLFVFYALVTCIRTKIPRRKWLWLLFVGLGVVQFQFNWANGAWRIQPLTVLLLGVGFTRPGPVAPYIFNLAFPLGAIVFLAKRKSLSLPNSA